MNSEIELSCCQISLKKRVDDYLFALSYPSLAGNLTMNFQNWMIILRDLGKCFFENQVDPKQMKERLREPVPFKIDFTDMTFILKLVIKENENGQSQVCLMVDQLVIGPEGGVRTLPVYVPFSIQDWWDLRTFVYEWIRHFGMKPEEMADKINDL